MTPGQVLAHFTAPASKEEVNFGGGPTPQIDWIYNLSGGTLRLQFDVGSGSNNLTGYTTDSPALKTRSGYGIGTPISTVKSAYGDQLSDAPFGSGCDDRRGGCLLSEGAPGTIPGLIFTYDNGLITDISGGELQAAGE
jgi:hypothetical protein